ncbi:MAG: hypothetical protein WBP42_12565 [Candidatus Zixiibacteriota bacterium]
MCKELIELYDKLQPRNQEHVMAVAKTLAENERFNKRLEELTENIKRSQNSE